METAITARLYFVLFSGAANSNNKLSPILPLQFPSRRVAGLLAKSPEPATELPFPSFRSPGFDCPPPTHSPPPVPRFLRVSQRFVSRTFPKRPRFPSSSRLPRYPPVPPPPPPLLTARSPLRAHRIFHGIPAFFNDEEGKNVRLRMKDQPRVRRDEKSSSGLLRSFRKPSFVPRIGNIEQTGRRDLSLFFFFLLFLGKLSIFA